MRINIYQVDSDKDENRVKFCNYDYTQQHGGVLSQNYKCVFHGDVDVDLEDVFTLFNTPEHPGTYQGHSLSVSDVIEVVGENEEGITPGSYFTDSFGFIRSAMARDIFAQDFLSASRQKGLFHALGTLHR